MTRCLRCQRRLPPSGECPDHGRATAVSAIAELEPPPRIIAPHGWTLGRFLAAGGTALVSQVQRDGRPPAVLKFARNRDRETRARFALEADVLRAVGPPTTPECVEHGLVDDWPYLIMEHVPGETLGAWMSRNRERGGLGEIVAILGRVAGALAGLHAAGFVHRDLKPENIVIGPKGVRILDFGLVKPIATGGGPRLTQIGSVVGTPHYLAPEQIRMSSQVDHRSDLYSLGVIAFEMLAGRPPFIGERQAIEYHHQVCRPPSVTETRSIPQALDEIVVACLAKDPSGRPRDADELRVAFSNALNQEGTLRGVVATPEPRAEVKQLGATGSVALTWIEYADVVAATRALTEMHGIVVGQRGDGLLAAFSAQHHDAPLSVALGVCRTLVGERRRIAVHLTTALVRRSAHGKPMVYGADLEQVHRWIPTVPYTGLVLTAAAAASLGTAVAPASDTPGFFREVRRDRTDATDAKVDPPMIGREALLRSLFSAAHDHRSMLVGISGAPGSGKTRVLGAVLERLQAVGHEVIPIAGRRRFLGDRRDDDRVVVALGGSDLRSGLAAVSARNAIVAIDNFEWLSPAIRAALIDAPVPLVRIIASVEPVFEVMDFAADRISVVLPPMSHADADKLLRELLRPARLIPDALVERLVIRGMGNPGLLLGLARDIKRRGAIRRQVGGDDWYVAVDELDTLLVPPGPSWFAHRILDDLPVELAVVARRCAALGPKFCAHEVAAVTEGREVEVNLALLVREGLFEERSGWFEFVEPALQEAIYDHVLDERDLVHRRALAYWTATEFPNVVGRIARVAFHAAGAGERATCGACWAALARHAARAGDKEQADELLARTIAVLGTSLSADFSAVLDGLDSRL